MATATVVVVEIDLLPIVGKVSITRADQILFGWIFEDDAGPIDFTGDAMLLTVNSVANGSGTEHFQVSEFVTLTTDGKALFKPLITDLELAVGTNFFDVQWTEAGGDRRTLIKGEFIIGPEITS